MTKHSIRSLSKYAPKLAQNLDFLKLMKNLGFNFFFIWFIIKVNIICCIPAQIPYLGKICFLRNWPKCSQLIRLQDFQIK